MRQINVAIIGGSGFWSELNHHKHLLNLKSHFNVRLCAIVDPVAPNTIPRHKNMQKLMQADAPVWIDPDDHKSTESIMHYLRERCNVELVIVACNPTAHYEYSLSCLQSGINVICDKPIVSVRNASTNPEAAKKIVVQYDTLLDAYNKAKLTKPRLLCHSILRRRSLRAFTRVAEELEAVHDQTGAGINNMTLFVNGGINKFPLEFTIPGAHGYLDGIGSLAHSAYHYIDILGWYLSKAPGSAVAIQPNLNYAYRVRDYLAAQSYTPIARLTKTSKKSLEHPILPATVAGCELNSGFTLKLLDRAGLPVGMATFMFNHVSFCPRINPFDVQRAEPANYMGGGRMSHIVMDVNQGGVQSWEIYKNNVVFEGNTIELRGRRHPLLHPDQYVSETYENAYDSGLTMEDLLAEVLTNIANDDSLERHTVIRALEEERLVTRLYASFYELIAADYVADQEYIAPPIPIPS